jgi:hypothetical protein
MSDIPPPAAPSTYGQPPVPIAPVAPVAPAAAETELQFDTAHYAQGAAPAAARSAQCNLCGARIQGEYWYWAQKILCANCRDRVLAAEVEGKSGKTFLRAFLRGGLVALGGGIAYAIFVAVLNVRLALITIGVAFLIAQQIQKATHGFSDRRHQVLAVVLTYFVGAMGYAPGLFMAIREDAHTHHAAGAAGSVSVVGGDGVGFAAPETASDPAKTAADSGAGATSASSEAKPAVGLGTFLLAIASLVGVCLALPILNVTTAPMGLIIIGIGLWEAWRRTSPIPTRIGGPYRVGDGAGPA